MNKKINYIIIEQNTKKTPLYLRAKDSSLERQILTQINPVMEGDLNSND